MDSTSGMFGQMHGVPIYSQTHNMVTPMGLNPWHIAGGTLLFNNNRATNMQIRTSLTYQAQINAGLSFGSSLGECNSVFSITPPPHLKQPINCISVTSIAPTLTFNQPIICSSVNSVAPPPLFKQPINCNSITSSAPPPTFEQPTIDSSVTSIAPPPSLEQPTNYNSLKSIDAPPPFEQPINCGSCLLTFLNENAHKEHIRNNITIERTYVCFQCADVFCHPMDLVDHMGTHPWEKSYKCLKCRQDCNSPQEYVRHCANHSRARPHKCPICGKAYVSERTLNFHMMAHSQEKNQRCNICNKTFWLESQLSNHMKIHNQQRPHKCKYCVGKDYIRLCSLETHMRVHEIQSLFKCNHCKVYFPQKSVLNAHMKRHYVSSQVDTSEICHCRVCNKSYMNKSSLKTHLEKIHYIHECPECGRHFNCDSNLKQHTYICNGASKKCRKPQKEIPVVDLTNDEAEVSSSNQMCSEEQVLNDEDGDNSGKGPTTAL